MTFVQYVQDKKYFLLVYALMMAFVSLVMLTGTGTSGTRSNVLYVNAGCLVLAAGYIVTGYIYRKSYYDELRELSERHVQEDGYVAALPEPQTNEQALYLALLTQVYAEQAKGIAQLQHERKDHQDYILSWIHEVKVPIAGSRLIMENGAGKPAEVLIDKLEDELGKIDSYVEQALYYSRIDAFSQDYFITEVSLPAIAKDSVKKVAKLFIHKRIRPNLGEVTHSVSSDSKWLAYIVDQVVANALTYTNSGGTITFRSEESDAEKRLLIQDTGIGIPPEELGRVFDKGFTGSAGRSHHKSTGLGLYLAKQLALKLGHDLSIVSTLGEGTTVTLHFPKVRRYNDLR